MKPSKVKFVQIFLIIFFKVFSFRQHLTASSFHRMNADFLTGQRGIAVLGVVRGCTRCR